MRHFAVPWVVLLSVVLLTGAGPVVVDHAGEDRAVVFVESDERAVDRLVVDVDVIPPAARRDGAVVRIDGGFAYDASATERRRSEAAGRLDRLSEPLSALTDEAGESVAREGRSESGLPHVRPGRLAAPRHAREGI